MRRTASIAASAALISVLLIPQGAIAGGNTLGQCVSEARRALAGTGIHFSVGQFDRILLGTSGDDRFVLTTASELVCGFAGRDSTSGSIKPDPRPSPLALGVGDVFVGGSGPTGLEGGHVPILAGGLVVGDDPVSVGFGWSGTVVAGPRGGGVEQLQGATLLGGPATDIVEVMASGLFRGGGGRDLVLKAFGGGTFDAGDGSDYVDSISGGTYNGGPGDDHLFALIGGRFNGQAGDDHVSLALSGTFDGGEGTDTVADYRGGTLISVP